MLWCVVRASLKERVKYADEMMEQIMDSADQPMEVGIKTTDSFLDPGFHAVPIGTTKIY